MPIIAADSLLGVAIYPLAACAREQEVCACAFCSEDVLEREVAGAVRRVLHALCAEDALAIGQFSCRKGGCGLLFGLARLAREGGWQNIEVLGIMH